MHGSCSTTRPGGDESLLQEPVAAADNGEEEPLQEDAQQEDAQQQEDQFTVAPMEAMPVSDLEGA